TITEIYGKINTAFITSGSASFTSSFYKGALGITGKSNKSATGINLSAGSSKESAGNITSISGFGNTTILGWYNTTFKVVKVIPALYGLKAMNGAAELWLNVSIKNVSHQLTIDPYYQGMQNASLMVTILSNTTIYSNVTFKVPDTSQNLTIVGLAYKGYMNDLTIKGTMSITDPYYNLTNNYAYTYYVPKVPFFATDPFKDTDWNTSDLVFVSGDVPTIYNESETTLWANISSPIKNLTLTPLANISLSVSLETYNYTSYYEIYDAFFEAAYVTPFTSANNSVFQFSGQGYGQATIGAYVQNSYITLQGSVNGVTFTTNAIDVLNAGPIPVSGLTTSQYGSGTLSGTVNIAKIYPINCTSNSIYPSQVMLSGSFNLQGFYANGTQYYITVSLMNTVAGQSLYMALTTPVSASFTTTLYNEMANSGVSSALSYPLLNGSGALVMSISNQQIAEIATLTGQYVNITLNQLGAQIKYINGTTVGLETNFGYMNTTLKAINATVISISNGVATVKTALGTVQTSLANLNATVLSINGNVATIMTNAGKVMASLNAINATLASV
ncbi:MAG: hypothetical protein ACPLVI_08380, partial [Thermoplasmata archaeon]